MDNSYKFRELQEKDINDVLEIYNYHISNGLSNFEEEPLLYEDFYQLCMDILNRKLPFLICVQNDKIIGFSYLSNFRNKSGYKYSFENSVYVHSDFIGLGIGNHLLKKLIQLSKKDKKIKTILAIIGNSSMASVKIHKKNGFIVIGTLEKVGFKNNQWLNAIYMQKILY